MASSTLWLVNNASKPSTDISCSFPGIQPGLHLERGASYCHRKQTLDLAQQAQVAAFSYLGVDPNEPKYLQHFQRQQANCCENLRPLEFHLHHHHHHYAERTYNPPSAAHVSSNGDFSVKVGIPVSSYNLSQGLLKGSAEQNGTFQNLSQNVILVRKQYSKVEDPSSCGLNAKPAVHLDSRETTKEGNTIRDRSSCFPGSSEPLANVHKSYSLANKFVQSSQLQASNASSSSGLAGGKPLTPNQNIEEGQCGGKQSSCLNRTAKCSMMTERSQVVSNLPGRTNSQGHTIQKNQMETGENILSQQLSDSFDQENGSANADVRPGLTVNKRKKLCIEETGDITAKYMLNFEEDFWRPLISSQREAVPSSGPSFPLKPHTNILQSDTLLDTLPSVHAGKRISFSTIGHRAQFCSESTGSQNVSTTLSSKHGGNQLLVNADNLDEQGGRATCDGGIKEEKSTETEDDGDVQEALQEQGDRKHERKLVADKKEAEFGLGEKNCALVDTMKTAEERICSLLYERAFFQAKLEKRRKENSALQNLGEKEKIKCEALMQESSSVQCSPEGSADFYTKAMRGTNDGNNRGEFLPINVGALQGDGNDKVIREEEDQLVCERIHFSKIYSKIAEEQLLSLLDERALLLAKFEEELARRNRNESSANGGDGISRAQHALRDDFEDKRQNSGFREKEMVLMKEVAEDRLEEKARFHAKFEEALRQGNIDRIKLQQLLELGKSKHELSRSVLEKMRRNFEYFWNMSTGTNFDNEEFKLRREKIAQSLARLQEESYSAESVQMETQITAEEAHKFEALDKVAGKQINIPLDKKTQHHQNFEDGLEKLQLDRLRLQQLLKLEKEKYKGSKKELEKVKQELEARASKAVQKIAEGERKEVARKSCPHMRNKQKTKKSGVERPQSEWIQSDRTMSNDEIELFELSSEKGVSSTNKFMLRSNTMKKYKKWEMLAKSEILKLVKGQEFTWKSAEDAVGSLERRVKLLEDEKVKLEEAMEQMQYNSGSKQSIECVLTKLERGSMDENLVRHYSCIYMSPIFEDGKSRSAHKKSNGEERQEQQKKDSMDNKKDLDIQELKAEIERLRALRYEDARNKQADMLFDKVISNRIPSSMPSTHDEKLVIEGEEKKEKSIHIIDCKPSSEVSRDSLNAEEERSSQAVHYQVDHDPGDFMKVMEENVARAKMENREPFPATEHDDLWSLLERLACHVVKSPLARQIIK